MMRPLRLLSLCAFASAVLCGTAAIAQQAAASVRIVNAIDENSLVTLKGNTHPAANARNDRGLVSPTLPMSDLLLVLSRSAEQQAAFDKFVAAQYDPNSPDFHRWLAPEEVGSKFGPSQTDIATISNWLTGHGFSVDEVSKDRMSIRFSGTAALVQSAFHVEMHNLEVNGIPHIANMSDPQIPAALAPVVLGVKSLHNFFAKPMHHLGGQVTRDSNGKFQRVSAPAIDSLSGTTLAASKVRPDFGIGSSPTQIEDVTPYDFAAIYNVLPLWNAGITGSGQTIAIAGTSLINVADVATFKSTFGLPTGLTPQLISANSTATECTSTSSTATCGIGDLTENTLDVEWSGAIAPQAQVILVVSGVTTPSTDTVYTSADYVVQHNTAKILNVSYGQCELFNGTASNAAYNSLWQTAASQGIAVFVSSGDSGAASCDQGFDSQYGTPWAAQYGLSVSGLASTPYNTAVGGTDLNWCTYSSTAVTCAASPYWNSSNAANGSSAKGYIPEVPWNDSCTNPLLLYYIESIPSQVNWTGTAVTDPETGCNFLMNDWLFVYNNFAINNSPADISSLADTVGGSGGASNCTTSNGNTVASCTGGYPKPTWQAGVLGIPPDGKRDIPDVSFFASNGFLGSSYLICLSEVGAGCTYSTTTENTSQEIGGTSASSPAMAGVMALINQKAGSTQGNPNKALYALAAKQTYSGCSTENGTVGNGCYFNDIDTGTAGMPCDYGALDGGLLYNSSGASYLVAQQPGIDSPNCSPIHSGDTVGIQAAAATTGYDLATGLGSLNVANVVNALAVTGTGAATVTVTPASSSIAANQSLSVPVTVTGGSGTATGTVTLTGGGYASAAETLVSGAYTFTIPGDSLSAGTDTLTVSYSGDPNYASATGTASVVVNKLAATVGVTLSANAINTNQSLTVSGSVTGSGGTPTGTVTLSGGGYTSSAQTLSNGGYSFAVPAGSLTAGSDTLTVAYSGDATYSSENGSATVTVTAVVTLIPTVTVSPASSSIDSNQSLSVPVTVSGTSGAASGTVTLTGGGYTSSAGTLSSGAFTFSIPANSLSAGTDTLTVTYTPVSGSVYTTNTGTATVTVTESVFTLAAAAPTAISSPGGSTTSTVSVSSTTGYTGTVTLTCALTSGPAQYSSGDTPSCSIPSSAVSVGGTATATVSTTAAVAELAYPKLPGKGGWAGAGGGAVLAFLVFLGIPARRRSWRAMLGMLVLMAALGSMAACGGGGGGGGGNSDPGTAVGTYTFTVNGTGTPAVTPAPSITFTVTVN